jgi:basic membrane protein A
MKFYKLIAFAAVIALVFGLWITPQATLGASKQVKKICIVNEPGGSDSPFNLSVAEGVKRASSKLHVETVTLDATTEAEVVANIDTFVTAGDCDLIIGNTFIVGFLLEPFINANPGQLFAVIDFSFGGFYPNVADVIFEVNEAAFLAGYVAAGLSETGYVGVFGGWQIHTVTLYMDGYALGVEYFNAQHGASVEVLGWDPDLQTGLFSGTFTDPAAGQELAAGLYDEGADTVFPVAGLTGFGALDAAALRKATGETARVIGVDFDWSGTFGDPERVILTSAIKNPGSAVFNQIEALVNGTWQGGIVSEGLENNSVDIAKFHKIRKEVPGSINRDLKDIREGIINGSIPTTP